MASSTASSWRLNSRATAANSSGLGSYRPIQTNASGSRPASKASSNGSSPGRRLPSLYTAQSTIMKTLCPVRAPARCAGSLAGATTRQPASQPEQVPMAGQRELQVRSIPLVTGGDDPADPPRGGPSGLPEALLEVATALNSGLDREEVFGRIAAQLQRLVPFTALVIGRADPDARVVTPVFAQGGGPEQELAPRIPFGEGLTGRAAETGEVVVYNADEASRASGNRPASRASGIREHAAEGAPPASDRRMLVLPLVGPDGVEGTLTLFRDGSGQPAWRDDEVHLARLFAAQAQVAVHNAELWSAAEERAKRLAAMNGILQAASGSLDVAAICRAYEQ